MSKANPLQTTVDELERFLDDYIECYELDDGESHHEPTEHERFLIADAINGLIADDDFLSSADGGVGGRSEDLKLAHASFPW